MGKISTILLIIIFFSCSNKKTLELEFLNKELVCYSFHEKKDTINIINYRVTNKSNNIYFINNIIEDNKLMYKSVYKEGKNIRIFNSKGKEVNYITIVPNYPHHFTIEDSIYYKIITKPMILNSSRLGYKEVKRYALSKGGFSNFFIHPNETLYFQYYINLTDTISNEDFRIGYADLKKGMNYYAKLSIASDSSNYKNDLPRDILKTIKANNVKVYHGIIESSNKVPINLIE